MFESYYIFKYKHSEMYFENVDQIKNIKVFKEDFKNFDNKLDNNLKNLIEQISKVKIYNCSGFILLLIRNNFKGDWVNEFNNKPKNIYDKDFLIKLFGEEIGYKIWDNKRKKTGCRIENYINKYGLEEGTKLFKQKACDSKKGQSTKDFYINKYGLEEGVKKWNKIKNKWGESYKKNKQNHKGNGRTLEEYIIRLGKDTGKIKWEERNNKQKFRFSKEFYLQKYGAEEGEKEWNNYLKNQDKTSLKSFIKKYGEIDGTNRYNFFIEKQKNGFKTNLENFILKYGEDIGTKKYQNWIINCTNSKINGNRYSKISQKLFWEIYENLSIEQKHYCKFAELNNEQMFKIWKHNLTVIFVDFKLKDKIIEFQGTYYHKFSEAKERDKNRLIALKEKGYQVLFIEQKEYETNKNKVINDCLNFLNYE